MNARKKPFIFVVVTILLVTGIYVIEKSDTIGIQVALSHEAVTSGEACVINFGGIKMNGISTYTDTGIFVGCQVTEAVMPMLAGDSKDVKGGTFALPVQDTNNVPSSVIATVLAVLGAIGLLGAIPGATIQSSRMLTVIVFARKKIKGVVYDSSNKEPLDPVYVSVIDTKTNTEVANQITDLWGRFGFVLNAGTYKVVAQKTHYQFPSQKLSGVVSDEIYDNLYFGQPFQVIDEQHVVAMNIPMDKIETDWNQQEKHRLHFMQYLLNGQTKYGWIFNLFFVIGFFASLLITYLNPVWWNVIMTVLYVPLALLQVYGHKWIPVGVLTKNGIPLANVTVRVRNEHGYEVGHKVTNAQGGYYLLVPAGKIYSISVDQKNADNTFTTLFTSQPLFIRTGVINRSFEIK